MKPSLSIIIPTLNEAENIPALFSRIDSAVREKVSNYEIIIVDDRSTDDTVTVAQRFAEKYPIRVYTKLGTPGKAYSLLEGFSYASYDILAIIDADLQYPPEAFPEMIEKIGEGAGVVVANRQLHDESVIRALTSKIFAFVFVRLLHGLRCDAQSGLKVFRRNILDDVYLHPTPWTFDLEFLVQARAAGHDIKTVNIRFANRVAGQSKINVFKASIEIGWHACVLKMRTMHPRHIAPSDATSMRGAGVQVRGQHYITHTTLSHHHSAITTFVRWQKWFALGIGFLLSLGALFAPWWTATLVIGVLSTIYFFDVLFNLFLVRRSLLSAMEIRSSPEELAAVDETTLPVYTILCPLYREAHVLPGFIQAIERIDWPKDRLEVLLLLEENDPETIQAAAKMALPAYVTTLIVPHSLPKTKPKACNYGLSVATGEYLVIYDAEDIPDPQQLKKAYVAFQKVDPSVKCLQAKLNYFNPHQNFLTRLFTAEYSLWFDVVLTGLQSLQTNIPLGGTSNHFRTAELRGLQGWDPFNVTEDCDLGIRLFQSGYTTAVIDSTTYEEANSQLGNWLRQRSRWIKGYMQTYLVHLRRPWKFHRDNGFHAVSFQLVVGGKIAFALINPILWATTIIYFVFRSTVGPTIEALYPPLIFAMAGVSLIFGNFLFLIYYMIGCAKRGQWDLMKYVYAVPAYWLATSVAAYVALYELIVRPHYWQKTTHGLQHRQSTRWWEIFTFGRLSAQLQRLIPRRLWQAVGAPGGLLIIAMMVANGLNLIFNAYLGRVLTFEDLGVLTFFNTLWYISSVFFTGVGSAINEQTSYWQASGDRVAVHRLLHGARGRALFISGIVMLVWVAALPAISSFFHVAHRSSLGYFTPLFALGLLVAINRGYLHGSFLFRSVAIILCIETVVKLVFAIFLVAIGRPSLAYLAIPVSVAIATVVSYLLTPRVRFQPVDGPVGFPGKFYVAALFASISSVIFLSLDVILVQHFLTAGESGQYALVSLVGKMIYFFGSLPIVFMIPMVRRLEGKGESTAWVFRTLMLMTTSLVVAGWVALGLFGAWTIPSIFGEKSRLVLPWIRTYSAALALFTITTSMTAYHLAKKHYLFPLSMFVLAASLAISVWSFHRDIHQIVSIIFRINLVGFLAVASLHVAQVSAGKLRTAWRDFVDIFLPIQECGPKQPGRQRILFMNWRDTKHVYAGGAEIYVHEIARHWVRDGHQVMMFSGNDGRSARNETVDGIHVIRRGGFFLVYFWAAVYYLFRLRQCDFDVIIDCQNGIPFFTPLYSRRSIYCLMHHVHQEVFTRSLPRPIAAFARLLEKRLMPVVYRRVPFITVSASSKHDIVSLGMGRAGIDIVHPGVNLHEFIPGKKHPTPQVLYLGRLKAYKSIDVLIRAFDRVIRRLPEARLIIAGSGETQRSLRELVQQLGLQDRVTFEGKVSHHKKIELLQQSWLLVNPSFMEGWGITSIEANACATPVVAANVPGLRDSVKNAHSGFLVEHGNIEKFSNHMLDVLQNAKLRQELSDQAITWAGNFAWSQSSRNFLNIIHPHVAK